jgi:ribonuclease HIII
MSDKSKTKKAEQENLLEEEEESYLKYIMKDNTITINVYDGGTVIFQQGKPKDGPP